MLAMRFLFFLPPPITTNFFKLNFLILSHITSVITSTNVAIAIITFGLISFVVKYFLWKREAKQKSSDFLQNE